MARDLIENLDPRPTPEARAAWSREIERRVGDIEEGTVDLADWAEVRAELFADG
jgi:hypothetical protein